jgi:hypothetical protein
MPDGPLTTLSAKQLRQAAVLREKIDSLTQQLSKILGEEPAAPAKAVATRKPKRKMSAAARAKIAAAQRRPGNGLLMRWDKEIPSQEGRVAAVQRFEDYREVDDVNIPFKMTVTAPQLTFTTELNEAKHNVEVPKGRFTKPSR